MWISPSRAKQTVVSRTAGGLQDVATVIASWPANTSGRQQFLAGYDGLKRASPESRKRVIEDPRTGIWIDDAQGRIAATGGRPPGDALLQEWALWMSVCALSAAFLDGVDFGIDEVTNWRIRKIPKALAAPGM